jgi:predicted aspartyl protease
MKLAIVILALWLAPGSTAQEPPAVPFHLIEGWAIVLEGTLASIPNCRIMIDTGAVPSAINSKFVKHLGLTGTFERISVMNRSVNAQKLRVPDVRIGPVSAESLDMMAVDLERIEQRLNTRIDAVIGLDFLARRSFRLDYRHKKLSFTSNAGADSAGAIAFEIQHESGGAYILLPLRSGGQNLQVLLDTGTKDLTLFDRRLGGMLQRLRVLGKDSNVTAAGRDPIVSVEMDAISVGPVFREKQKAFVLTNSEEDSRRFDGILGPAALGAIAVAFDFDRHFVSLETHNPDRARSGGRDCP